MLSSAAQPKAIFSTRLGKTIPRDLSYPLPPVIARSNGFRQVADYASQLREQYSLQCNQIFNISSLSDYFDRYDIHLQSPAFLAAVLNHIIQENLTNIKNFTYDWSIAHRFELIKLCEPVSAEKIFDTNLIEKYGVIFLNIALQHMRNSLAALSRQQAMAKDADTNHEHQQFSKDNMSSGNMANPLNIGHGKTAFRKKNWVSNSSNSPAGSGNHKFPNNFAGTCLSDRKHHSQREKGSDEVLSQIDPAIIRNGQSIPSQRSISSPDALQGPGYPSEQHWSIQIRDYGPDFWASPNERGVYRSSRPGIKGSRQNHASWYGGSGNSGGKQYRRNGYSQTNSLNAMPAHDTHMEFTPYSSMSPVANNRTRSALENLSPNGSSPSQIKGSTPSTRSTDSFSPGWPYNTNSKPYETGTVVRSQGWTSHSRQSHGTASRWQNIHNHASLLQSQGGRRLSLGSDFGRPMLFGHGISYKPDNIVLEEGCPIDQFRGSHDLRMAKSRSLSSSNHQGTFMKNNFACVPSENAGSDIAIRSDPGYFCNKHTIGHKRNDVRTVWVTSIQNASLEELTALFGSYGTIEDVEFRDGSAIASRYAFIRFGSSDEARESLKLHGTFFQDKYLSVQVPRKYWTLPSIHDYSKYSPKSNGNSAVNLISGTQHSLHSCRQNMSPPGHINLPRMYPGTQFYGHLGNYSNFPSQQNCVLNGQGNHLLTGPLPYETYQSHERQVFNFDVAAGSAAGNPSLRDVRHKVYGIKVIQNAWPLAQSRSYEMNKKLSRNSSSGLNEKHSARIKSKNGKTYNCHFKPSAPDNKSPEEKQPRLNVGSIDHSINVDKDIQISGGKDQLESGAQVCVPLETETSGEASGAFNGNTAVETLPEVSTADFKTSSESAKAKSSQLHEQDDQYVKLAFSEINSVEISLALSKVDNSLNIDPRAAGIGLDDNSNDNDLIASKLYDFSEKRGSLEGDNDVNSMRNGDVPGRSEIVSESRCGGQEIESLAENTILQDSQVHDSIPDDKIVKTPLPRIVSTEDTNACASTMKNSLKETNAAKKVSLTKKSNTSDITFTNTKIAKKQHDPGHTDSIHPFARAKNMKKKGKKIKKSIQLREKDEANDIKVSKLKSPETVAKMPLDMSVAVSDGKNDSISKTPLSLGNSVIGFAVNNGDTDFSYEPSVSRLTSSKSELANGKFQSEEESTPKDRVSISSTTTPEPTVNLNQFNEVASVNVGEETHLGTCGAFEVNREKELYSTSLAHEKTCAFFNEHNAVEESAERNTNGVSPLSVVGKYISETGSKTSSLKKKKKKRSSRSKALSTAQSDAHPNTAQDTASEMISNPTHVTETKCQKPEAIVDLHDDEHEKGVAGLGLVIVDSKAALSGSTISPAQRSSTNAVDDVTNATKSNSHPDNTRHGNETISQISASINHEDSARADSSIGQTKCKEIHQQEKTQNADGRSYDSHQQQGDSAASEAKEDEHEGKKEQRPALHVQRVSYAAAAAAMAVAGEMAKAAKRSALSDHSRAVEETLIRLEKLHEKEMMEKAGGLCGSALTSATASTLTAQR